MIKIVALTGPKGAGKSTLASNIEALIESKDIEVVRLSFATPLKMACHIMFGGEVAHWFGNKKEEILPHIGKTPRELMQKLGTDFVRDMVDPLLWIKTMRANINNILVTQEDGLRKLIIVDDMRFPNEAELLQDLGAHLYSIKIEDAAAETSSLSQHRSEAGIDPKYLSKAYSASYRDFASLKNIAAAIFKSCDF